MTELQQLRKEINELRERLAKLEARESRIEERAVAELRKQRDEWLKSVPYTIRPPWTIT